MELISKNRMSDFYQKPLKEYLIYAIYLLPVLTVFDGFLSIISGIVFLMVIVFSLDEKFYLLFPILIIFYAQLVVPGGIVVYRVFTLLYLLNIAINDGKIFKSSHISIILITVTYSLFVLLPSDFRGGVMIIFDILFLLAFSANSLDEARKIREFFKYVTIGVIMAGVYGIVNSTNNMSTFINVNGSLQSIFRVVGTFEDPNYFGLYINIVIFSNLIIDFFKSNLKRIFVLLFLYYLLFSTLSLTGILCNLGGLFLYLTFVKKLNIKYIFGLAVIVATIVVFLNSEAVHNIPVLNDFLTRFDSMQSTSGGSDIGQITSGRSRLWSDNWQYFKEQSVARVFLGGNRIVPISIDFQKFSGISHMEYLDQLLNVGLIGFAFLNLYFLSTVMKHFSLYLATLETEFLMILFSKYVWFFYGFSLTLFLDSRFMLFFLI